ncbi:methyltransferase domain-containing protein [bacterium]|nr:methyltransferase domain-containing protein [bacterium]
MTNPTVTITTLTTQGEGLGKIEGKVVFVPFALPGETWEIEIVDRRKKYDRALPLKCLSSDAPEIPRAEPPCPYYGACGGCQLQHTPYDEQLRLKRDWLLETFQRLAQMEAAVNDLVPSPPWEYRNKVTIPIIQNDNRYALAYHKQYQPDEHEPVMDCPIAHATIRRFIPVLVKALNAVKPTLKSYSQKSQGSRAVFRIHGQECLIALEETDIPAKKVDRFIDRLFEPGNSIDALEIYEEGTKDKLTITKDKEDSAPGVDTASFVQVNDAVCESLYEYVVNLPYEKNQSILDGYCGTGILTRCLADRFETTVGVEAEKTAAQDAQDQVKKQGLEGRVRIHHRAMERYLDETDDTFDAVIVNPPRAGLSEPVREKLLKTNPRDIVIISCHPAAMIRDLQNLLQSNYEIDTIQPFDMFPQTYHLETVVHLKKAW